MPYVVYVVTNAKGYVPMQLKFYPRYEIHLKIITEREISVTLLGEMQRDLLKDGLHTWARWSLYDKFSHLCVQKSK